jgi:DNA-binding transcriptional MerR regulator
MGNLLNIAALSRRTGVAPDTLRKWEQRYGVLHPTRTAGGQRRYTEQDVSRVEWLRDRLREGWRIGEAARVLESSSGPALDDPADLRAALVEAATAPDSATIDALLDQAFAVLPVDTALHEVVAPTLRAVGEEWHAGRLTVAQEHALSAKVRSRLDVMLGDARGGVHGTAVLACAPGEQHELGLLMLAVLLRADGWHVEYLGQDTPVGEAVEYAEATGARMLCFTVSRPQALAALRAGLASLPHKPQPALVVGGGGVCAEEARELRATYQNGNLPRAVARLRRLASA